MREFAGDRLVWRDLVRSRDSGSRAARRPRRGFHDDGVEQQSLAADDGLAHAALAAARGHHACAVLAATRACRAAALRADDAVVGLAAPAATVESASAIRTAAVRAVSDGDATSSD